MVNSDLVVREHDPQVAIVGYDQDEVQRFAQVVKSCAPWAKDLTNAEIGLSVRRALAMGLDPLNPHEVQIWKDNRGNINFQLAYTLMVEWVKRFKGNHTEPRFERLSQEQAEEEGIPSGAVAYRVRFVMTDDLPRMTEFMQTGLYDAREVRAMFEVTGVGVATSQEWANQYFAPNGRSKANKVQKRALIDAYRRKFGTPSRSEIETMRRDNVIPQTEIEDWERVAEIEDLSAHERARVASEYAGQRTAEPLTLTAEDKAAGAAALFGQAMEAETVEPEPEAPAEPMTFERAADFTTKDGRRYGDMTVDELTVIEESLSVWINEHRGSKSLNEAIERRDAIGMVVAAKIKNDDAAGRAAVDELQTEADSEAETLTPPEF